MGFKQVMEFIKIEHTLFSLPFVLIGYMIALDQFDLEPGIDLFWILLAAIGARGLAMALNRIIDREIDSHNPRTMNRHLVTGTMRIQTAWILAGVFMLTLAIECWHAKSGRPDAVMVTCNGFCYLSIPQTLHLALPFLAGTLSWSCTCWSMGCSCRRHTRLGINYWRFSEPLTMALGTYNFSYLLGRCLLDFRISILIMQEWMPNMTESMAYAHSPQHLAKMQSLVHQYNSL